MEPYLGKYYKCDPSSAENFEEYLKYTEVNYLIRKCLPTTRPLARLDRNADGSYTFEMYERVRGTKSTFRLGEEFLDIRTDSVKVMTTAEIDENRLYLTQVELNGRKSTHVCEFTPEVMTMTTTAEGWDRKTVRKFNLVEVPVV